MLLYLFFNFSKKQLFSEKPIVAVITSFNNAKWVYKNLDSIFDQEYKNFRVIYIDDCSTDGTAQLVEQYIKEKNVADNITLIKNKKRSIKMHNLYSLYHELNDWDIIAQIDGDDWLAHNNVFKLVNQEYCNGCWLAYTQFEISNGQKGCNALPPFWVRKLGTFRTYKPWFMYSHLKTFYAWLFKKIKLQDLFDDCQGVFQPLNDDAYMMYPMLEMARNHISFISNICYIFNVDSGFRPSLKCSKNNLFNEVLQRPAYQKVEKPSVDEQKNGSADIIIYAKNNDNVLLKNTILSIQKNISDLHAIYVVHQFNDKKIYELTKHCSDVIFLKVSELSKTIEQLQDFIVFINDQETFTEKISLTSCIKELEKTFAFGFFLNLNYNFFSNNDIMHQYLFGNIYAWKLSGIETKKLNSCAVLCRKKDIFYNNDGQYELETLIEKNIMQKNLVGLFLKNQNTQTI